MRPPRIGTIASVMLLAATHSPACAREGIRVDRNGVALEAADGDIRLDLGGRLHVDAAVVDDEITGFDNQGGIRRARIELSGRLFDKVRFRVDRDVAGASKGWRNVWVSVGPADGVTLRGGRFVAPFSLEDLASSNATTFMERSLANAFAPGFQRGVALGARGRGWTATGGYFAEPADDGRRSDGRIDDDDRDRGGRVRTKAIMGRITYSPVARKTKVVHLGLGVERRLLGDGREVRVRSGSEAGILSGRLVDTGTFGRARDVFAVNSEAAWLRGPFSLQGQYLRTFVDRDGRPDLEFDGWYAQASWILTAEPRRYARSLGVLGGPRLSGRAGAVEIAARYSMIDLEDETISGGMQRNVTLGINWYLVDGTRLMANYVHARADPNRRGADETLQIGQVRLQLVY